MPFSRSSRSWKRISSGSSSPFRNQNGRIPYSRGGSRKSSRLTPTCGHGRAGRARVAISALSDPDGRLDEPLRLRVRRLERVADLRESEAVRDQAVEREAARG